MRHLDAVPPCLHRFCLWVFIGRMQRFCVISTQKRMREEAGRFGQATTSGPAHCVFKLRRRYIKTPIICGSLAWEVLKSEQSPSTPTPLFSLSFHLSLLPPTLAAILRRTNPIMSWAVLGGHLRTASSSSRTGKEAAPAKMVKRKSLDDNEPECGKGIPFPIQTFLWRQTRFGFCFSRLITGVSSPI